MTSASTNIIQSGIPSRTALRVATLRAAHQLLDDPIVFEDPLALPILGEALSRSVRDDPFQFNDPMSRLLRAALVMRSRVAEDALGRAVQAGVTQYVVLGAGLDTFAYRNPWRSHGLRVFEVDHPSTQLWKQTLLKDAHIAIPPELAFAAADFQTNDLENGLRKAGFDFGRPACISWLGVTHYLSEAEILATLRFVADLPAGSEIIFDYRLAREMLNPIEQAISDYFTQYIAEMGEPFRSALDPAVFQGQVAKLGFSTVLDLNAAELKQRYLARRKDGLHVGGGFRMLHAKK